ncbi:hypothetical protein ACSFA7_26405 [Variovorax sp. LT1R20]
MPIEWLKTAETAGRYLIDNPTIIAATIAGSRAIVCSWAATCEAVLESSSAFFCS